MNAWRVSRKALWPRRRRTPPSPAAGFPELVGVALGAFGATQVFKNLSPLRPHAQTKVGAAFLAAGLQAFCLTRDPTEALVKVAVPATGMAMVIHRFVRAAQLVGDNQMLAYNQTEAATRRQPRRP